MVLVRRSQRMVPLPRILAVPPLGGSQPNGMQAAVTKVVQGDFRPELVVRSVGRRKIERRLAAILGADILGYSALMGRAEEDTHARVGDELDRMIREIEKWRGRVFSFAGDGIMAEFPSAVEALKCALRIQADVSRRNAKVPPEDRILFRIGLNSGEIVLQGERTGGTVVNVAARLEGIAEPGGICLSATVFEQVRRTVAAAYEPIGERRLKNIRDPVAAYGIPAAACSTWIGISEVPRIGLPAFVAAHTGIEYRPSLAVLPFRTMQRDQTNAYFAECMVDDIIRVLGGLKDLLVVSRSATLGFARMPLDVRRVGQELDVRYVVHGSVLRSRNALRIAVELSETQAASVIWADRFDGELGDLFELQDRIALRVAASIAPRLRERELDRALRKHPESMTAYDMTLRALDRFYRMDRQSVERARDLLLEAIAHDPDYATAHSYLASLYTRWIGQGWSSDEKADRTRAACAARMAIERDRNDALGLAIYGHMQSYLLKDYVAAQDYLERAIATGPSCAWGWAYSSLTRGYLGDVQTAVTRAEHAIRLSPMGVESFWLEHYLSQAYYLAERFDDAIGWGRMSAAHAGSNLSNLRCLIAALIAVGKAGEASELVQHHMQLAPNFRLSAFRARTPLRDAVRDRFIERLREAGMPE